MNRVVVVGASIAGVTAAGTLRAEGFDGQIVVLSEETARPYSRVPLSKGVLAGTQERGSAELPPLPDDIDLWLGARAVGLHTDQHVVELEDGRSVGYDGLVIATGARARRLAAEGQTGEMVVRTLDDADRIAERLSGARSAVVVGAGFLGMEVASTLRAHGLSVTVVDREPPLRRLLGDWLAGMAVTRARQAGVRIELAPDGVELSGDPVGGVTLGPGRELRADIVVSAVGDLPNVEWLQSSGLRLAGGLVVSPNCSVAPGIVAAGDVTVVEASPGVYLRTPHWTNAVRQGRTAATALLDPTTPPHTPDHYFWTEQFGLDLKMAGRLPFTGVPTAVVGDPEEGSALLQWSDGAMVVGAVSMNHRIAVTRLKAMVHSR